MSCSNDRATIGSYTILLLHSSSSNIPSHSWPNQSSDMAKWSIVQGCHKSWTVLKYNAVVRARLLVTCWFTTSYGLTDGQTDRRTGKARNAACRISAWFSQQQWPNSGWYLAVACRAAGIKTTVAVVTWQRGSDRTADVIEHVLARVTWLSVVGYRMTTTTAHARRRLTY